MQWIMSGQIKIREYNIVEGFDSIFNAFENVMKGEGLVLYFEDT